MDYTTPQAASNERRDDTSSNNDESNIEQPLDLSINRSISYR